MRERWGQLGVFRHIFRLPKACHWVLDGTALCVGEGLRAERECQDGEQKQEEERKGNRGVAPERADWFRPYPGGQPRPRLSDLHLLSFRAHTETLVREALLVSAQALQ